MPNPEPSANQCWICGSNEVLAWKPRSLERPLVPEDLQITDKRYGLTLALLKCQSCGFLFADAAQVDDLVGLYEQLDDAGYLESSDARVLQMKWLIQVAKTIHPQAKRLLDIGAGIGLLVAEANAQGFQAVGVEPSRNLVEIGKEKLGVDLRQGIFPHPELAAEKFDLICLVDVIEHVQNPVGLLAEIAKALAPDGRVIVVTPDVGSLAARTLKKRWWHFRLAHIGYFNSSNLSLAAERAGLKATKFLRAKWFFPVDYLASRLSQYLPLEWFNRLARKTPGLRWLYQRIVTLNLFDSWVAVMQIQPAAEANDAKQ